MARPVRKRAHAVPFLSRHSFFIVLALVLAVATGCARRVVTAPVPPAPTSPFPEPSAQPAPGIPPILPPAYSEQGVASWYGLPFHGRKASDGEVFDMNTMVAAHRTLPFNTLVRVTNMNNGRQVEVRIIDRGPFVNGRVIDLSFAAARAIDMIGSGIAPVRLEILNTVPPAVPVAYSVQIGAFMDRKYADILRAQVADRYPVYIQEFNTEGGHFYRVRVGRLATIAEAQRLAAELASDGTLQTFVVRLDGLQ
jgi:rare lipoprotein A